MWGLSLIFSKLCRLWRQQKVGKQKYISSLISQHSAVSCGGTPRVLTWIRGFIFPHTSRLERRAVKCRSEGRTGPAGTLLPSIFPHSCPHRLRMAAPSVLWAGGSGKGKAQAPPEFDSSKSFPQSITQLLPPASHWPELGPMTLSGHRRNWETQILTGGIAAPNKRSALSQGRAVIRKADRSLCHTSFKR